MLATLIVRFIHFADLSPGKTTSEIIPMHQQDLLITNPASVVEYVPDFHIPIMGVRNCALLQKELNKSSKVMPQTFTRNTKPPGAS